MSDKPTYVVNVDGQHPAYIELPEFLEAYLSMFMPSESGASADIMDEYEALGDNDPRQWDIELMVDTRNFCKLLDLKVGEQCLRLGDGHWTFNLHNTGVFEALKTSIDVTYSGERWMFAGVIETPEGERLMGEPNATMVKALEYLVMTAQKLMFSHM